ncbi:MAG: hypothetical protein AAF655_22170, partial [Bacteroidota bacterium]
GRAKMVLDTSGQGDRIYRDVMPGPKASGVDKSSWGLYVQNEEVLSWSLKPVIVSNPVEDMATFLGEKIYIVNDIDKYVKNANLPANLITWSGRSGNIWRSVVNVADQNVANGIPRLIDAILKDYDETTEVNATLKQYLDQYHSYKSNPNSHTPDAHPIPRQVEPKPSPPPQPKEEAEPNTPSEILTSLIGRVSYEEEWQDILTSMMELTESTSALRRMQDDVILLKGRITRLNNDFMGGIIGQNDFIISQNRLRKAILALIRRMKDRL